MLRRFVAVFWDGDEQRLRAGWRLLVALGGLLVLVSIGLLVLEFALPNAASWLVEPFAVLGATLAFVLLLVPRLDNRPASSIGLRIDRVWLTEALVGVGIGILAPVLSVIGYLLMGWATVDPVVDQSPGSVIAGLLASLLIVSGISILEEVFVRGYVFTNVFEGLASWISNVAAVGVAGAVTVVVFTLLHNGQFDGWLSISFYVVAALVFLLSVLLTGSLAMTIGIHTGLNFAWSAIEPVNPDRQQLIELSYHGPNAWTDSFGLMETVGVVFLIIPIVAWARYRFDTVRLRTLRPVDTPSHAERDAREPVETPTE